MTRLFVLLTNYPVICYACILLFADEHQKVVDQYSEAIDQYAKRIDEPYKKSQKIRVRRSKQDPPFD